MLRLKSVFASMASSASAGLARRYGWYRKAGAPFGKAHDSWQWDEL